MRSVITEQDVPLAGELKVIKGTIFTPSARDIARERGVRIVEVAEGQLDPPAPAKSVAIGSDHGGFQMKEGLKPILMELGFSAVDVGVHEQAPADYPDIAKKVADLVAAKKTRFGIIVDGAGIGSCMAANKVNGVRAALCYDKASARNSREHNDANVLTLGGRLLTQSQAEDVLRIWLGTPFGGGRHQARVDKIMALERSNFK